MKTTEDPSRLAAEKRVALYEKRNRTFTLFIIVVLFIIISNEAIKAYWELERLNNATQNEKDEFWKNFDFNVATLFGKMWFNLLIASTMFVVFIIYGLFSIGPLYRAKKAFDPSVYIDMQINNLPIDIQALLAQLLFFYILFYWSIMINILEEGENSDYFQQLHLGYSNIYTFTCIFVFAVVFLVEPLFGIPWISVATVIMLHLWGMCYEMIRETTEIKEAVNLETRIKQAIQEELEAFGENVLKFPDASVKGLSENYEHMKLLFDLHENPDIKEARAAYRKITRFYHPDRDKTCVETKGCKELADSTFKFIGAIYDERLQNDSNK